MPVSRTYARFRDDSVREPYGHYLSIREFPYCFAGVPLSARCFHLLPQVSFVHRDLQGDERVCLPFRRRGFPRALFDNQFHGLPPLFLRFVVPIPDDTK